MSILPTLATRWNKASPLTLGLSPCCTPFPEFFALVESGPLLGGSVPNLADYSFASLFAVAAIVIRNPITQVKLHAH